MGSGIDAGTRRGPSDGSSLPSAQVNVEPPALDTLQEVFTSCQCQRHNVPPQIHYSPPTLRQPHLRPFPRRTLDLSTEHCPQKLPITALDAQAQGRNHQPRSRHRCSTRRRQNAAPSHRQQRAISSKPPQQDQIQRRHHRHGANAGSIASAPTSSNYLPRPGHDDRAPRGRAAREFDAAFAVKVAGNGTAVGHNKRRWARGDVDGSSSRSHAWHYVTRGAVWARRRQQQQQCNGQGRLGFCAALRDAVVLGVQGSRGLLSGGRSKICG